MAAKRFNARSARRARRTDKLRDARESAARRRRPRSTATRRPWFRDARAAAQQRLRRFRGASLLAVAITGMLIVATGTQDVPAQQAVAQAVSADTAGAADTTVANPGQAVVEATSTLRRLAREFTGILPKIVIALGLIVVAAVLVRLVRAALHLVLRRWEKASAATAMSAVVIWLLAVGVALSVIAGDARALVGSVGLLGLALSWALQAPIESFAGWLVNSFKGYYRVGDRIAVGDVFGDVYRIDTLTTTVWEAGGPDKPVQGAQPTGALITFPNSEVLRANITNYTRNFPYVWDEVTVGIANESDAAYAMKVISGIADEIVGPAMAGPISTYRALLQSEKLDHDVADKPQVYIAATESWLDITIRYLVPARERRKWSSSLHLELATRLARPEYADRIIAAYPVRRVELRDQRTD